jgi:hypothetical protein
MVLSLSARFLQSLLDKTLNYRSNTRSGVLSGYAGFAITDFCEGVFERKLKQAGI